MCSYITERAGMCGSAKGPQGWGRIDQANVYYDHPYHAPLAPRLHIDFLGGQGEEQTRVAVEMSAESARALVQAILAALEQGDAAHSVASDR